MSRRLLRSMKTQRGIGLPAAIFLLTVMMSVAVAIFMLSAGSQTATSMDAASARAYQAARAGAEWGLYQQRILNNCANAQFNLPAGSTLSGYTVAVTCTASSGVVADLTTYRIVSTACNAAACGAPANNSPDYVQRVVDVRFSMPTQ